MSLQCQKRIANNQIITNGDRNFESVTVGDGVCTPHFPFHFRATSGNLIQDYLLVNLKQDLFKNIRQANQQVMSFWVFTSDRFLIRFGNNRF